MRFTCNSASWSGRPAFARRARGGETGDNGARLVHSRARGLGELHGTARVGDGRDIGNRQAVAVDLERSE
jgi:hypothetical protein